jgi:undecaprenyl-diphosphatase
VPIFHAILLGFLQGLTEFLPISSSGHLTLVPEILGWEPLDPNVATTFDVALHAGTLIGALAYLKNDVIEIIKGLFTALRARTWNPYAKLGVLLMVTTVPGALIGATLEDFISENLGAPALVATVMIVFGIVLYAADKYCPVVNEKVLTLKDAIFVGAAQAIALQPGVSRSGITMTALRSRGFSRESSARLSFLMLLPIVAGATLFTSTKTAVGEGVPSDLIIPMIAGVITSAITGWFAVFALLKYVRTHTFTAFVIYRIGVGIAVFAWIIFIQ